MTAITLDANYGYVLLAATSTVVLNLVHAFNTGSYRKAAKVPYPNAYAPADRTDMAAQQFNCAQRAHANFIESQPSMLAALAVAGIRFPLAAAAMGAGWTIFRWIYMVGYSSGGGDGKGRYKGIYWNIFHLALMGMAGYTGVQTVLGN